MSAVYLLENATEVGAGERMATEFIYSTILANGSTSSGSGAAAISILVSNTGGAGDEEWIVAGTINLTLGATPVADGFAMAAKWPHVKADLTSISGTGASVSVTMGR